MTRRRQFRLRALGTALFTLAALAIFAVYYTRVANEELVPLDSRYEAHVVLPTAVSLASNADVREAGLKVGRVKGTRVRGRNAVVLIALDDEHAPLHRDAEVRVREKTPAGEAYLEVYRGSGSTPEVPSGGILRINQAREYVSIDDVLSTFDADTRRSLRGLLTRVRRGFDGRGDDLNRLFEANAALVDEGGPVVRTLAEERRSVASFIDDFGRVMRALGDRRDDIRLLARRGRVAAEALASREEQFAATLGEFPGMIRQTRETTGRIAALSRNATPVIRDLGIGFEELAPAVRALRPASAAGRRVMRELNGFTREAEPLLRELGTFSTSTTRFIPQLDAFLKQYRPFGAYTKPFAAELGAHFGTLGNGWEKFGVGYAPRLQPVISESSYTQATPQQTEAYDALLELGALDTFRFRSRNAYPAPGTIENPQPFEGDFPRIQADE